MHVTVHGRQLTVWIRLVAGPAFRRTVAPPCGPDGETKDALTRVRIGCGTGWIEAIT